MFCFSKTAVRKQMDFLIAWKGLLHMLVHSLYCDTLPKLLTPNVCISTLCLQGPPMKQETSGKRHDVRSIIASSPRSYHNPASHLEMRAERTRYEEPKGRPCAVVSTASPIARSSPLTLGSQEGGKTHHSPVGYDDKGNLRTSYPGPSHRGSPLSREANQRQHDGGCIR